MQIFPFLISNGICTRELNSVECGYDGGDCIEFNNLYPYCDVDKPYLVGNGICDGANYSVRECGCDGGDCVLRNCT